MEAAALSGAKQHVKPSRKYGALEPDDEEQGVTPPRAAEPCNADPPAGCPRRDLASLHELKPPEKCGSLASRNSDPAECALAYEWREDHTAAHCAIADRPASRDCDASRCRDDNNDCCALDGLGEAAACEGEGYAVQELGAGTFEWNGAQYQCARSYTCCKDTPALSGCMAVEAELPGGLRCEPLPPPSPPPPPPPPSPPPSPPWTYLNHERCEALWADPTSRFHDLWGERGWVVRKPGTAACWGGDGLKFFDDAWWGRDCGRNWYTGNKGALGNQHWGGPTNETMEHHFEEDEGNVALLGFDESIDGYCGGYATGPSRHAFNCVDQGFNILSLYGDVIPYNICRNVEWQICAAKGTLPGQGEPIIKFAMAPKALQPWYGPHPVGSCTGYSPNGCGETGYASSDIFYMEACFYSMMCSNRDSLWWVGAGQEWTCQMEWAGFVRLRDYILAGL